MITARSRIKSILTAQIDLDKQPAFLVKYHLRAIVVFGLFFVKKAAEKHFGNAQTVDKRSRIIKKLQTTLDRARLRHSLRVEKIALKLGRRWGADCHKLSLAALLHDCARKDDPPGLLKAAVKAGIRLNQLSRFEPKLLHAELSARQARSEFGLSDQAILSAIRHHTVGRPRMSKLDKIIYLADHIEVGRRFFGINRIRQLAFLDLDRAVLESTSLMLQYLLDHKLPIFEGTIKTRNYYWLKPKQ